MPRLGLAGLKWAKLMRRRKKRQMHSGLFLVSPFHATLL
jgi:hypothetical protein